MIKNLIKFLNKLRISMKCCMSSSCSLNDENKKLDNIIDEEELKDSAVDDRAAF